MKIYIAGKITGLPETEALERFLGAENLLMHCGHTPLNPMKMVKETLINRDADIFGPYCRGDHKYLLGRYQRKPHKHAACLRCGRPSEWPYGEELSAAIRILLTQAEGVYFLDNYRDSRGAMIERYIAQTLEMPMFFKTEDIPLGCDWPEPKER